MRRHIPNMVTLSRGVAGPFVGLALYSQHHLIGFWLFIFAMLTDLIDGWLAKKLNAFSELGGLLDPICDKVLMNCTWLALWSIGWAPTWLALPLMVRDLLVSVGFTWARLKQHHWSPSLLARVMISLEGIALPFLLLHGWWWNVHWYSAGVLMGGITLLLSLASVLEYLLLGPAPRPLSPSS